MRTILCNKTKKLIHVNITSRLWMEVSAKAYIGKYETQ